LCYLKQKIWNEAALFIVSQRVCLYLECRTVLLLGHPTNWKFSSVTSGKIDLPKSHQKITK
jgi:hypothetical protein